MSEAITKIFLTHASENSALLKELKTGLESRGFETVLLNRQENPSMEPFKDINRQLADSKVAVAVISQSYLKKEWCHDEISAIWTLRQNDQLKLVIIRHYDLSESELFKRLPILAGQHIIDGSGRVESIVEEIDNLIRREERVKSRTRLEQNQPLPVILVGCGQWARERTILPLLKRTGGQKFRIVAVTDLLEEEKEFIETVKPALGRAGAQDAEFYRLLSRALEHYSKESPVAVAINTPNRFHEQSILIAIQAGCDVYAERPINRAADDLPKLIQDAKKRHLYLYTGTQRRLEYPYRYMRYVLEKRWDFGEVRSIRCTLASGRRCPGWRRVYHMSGGGVVIDEAYHLLDMAIWLGQVCEPSIATLNRSEITGSVEFKYKELGNWDRIETSASGRVVLPGDIELVFDFSYAVPEKSVFECLEFRDRSGARLRLLRDQQSRPELKKRPEPGKILHQDGAGNVIREGFVRLENDEFSFDGESSDEITADDSRPFQQFLQKVRSGKYDTDEVLRTGENDCDARFVLSTQELICAIYDLAEKKAS